MLRALLPSTTFLACLHVCVIYFQCASTATKSSWVIGKGLRVCSFAGVLDSADSDVLRGSYWIHNMERAPHSHLLRRHKMQLLDVANVRSFSDRSEGWKFILRKHILTNCQLLGASPKMRSFSLVSAKRHQRVWQIWMWAAGHMSDVSDVRWEVARLWPPYGNNKRPKTASSKSRI